jgi:hypothetical protein
MSSESRLLAVAILALQPLTSLADSTPESISGGTEPQLCTTAGAFGVRFGEPGPPGTSQANGANFDRGCVLFKPKEPHPLLATYAACISEFDGKVYQIQAATIFDDQPPKGSLSLTPEQQRSNRERGKQALDELMKLVPASLREKVVADPANRSWKLEVAKGTTLEVSNFTGWSVSLDCRNEAMAMEVFRKRIQGLGRK